MDGQRQLAHGVKQLLAASGHPLTAQLDYADDATFLEPSLFAWFSSAEPRATLDQILVGCLPVAARPASFPAWADDGGVVHLPGLGRLMVADAGGPVEVATSALDDTDANRTIHGTDIEYVSPGDPLFEPVFRDAEIPAPAPATDHRRALAGAFAILADVTPTLHESLLLVTRRIVTFEAAHGDSFTAVSAHGAAFLRPPLNADEVFFIEDLAHQCGHLLFSALSADPTTLVTVDPDMPLSSLAGTTEDPRTLHVALHGVFTECLMTRALHACLAGDIFPEGTRQRHELIGRLSFILKRLQLDLTHIRHDALYTDRGRCYLRSFEQVFDETFALARNDVVACDLTNQPYTFSYECFVELNGREGV
ncbi:MAG: hypothetical protein CMJ83_09740 [Planctomycetes bacterium]|nr:hypothetical protein [Planctomycetota bacterium]